jgi:hypothetical protein
LHVGLRRTAIAIPVRVNVSRVSGNWFLYVLVHDDGGLLVVKRQRMVLTNGGRYSATWCTRRSLQSGGHEWKNGLGQRSWGHNERRFRSWEDRLWQRSSWCRLRCSNRFLSSKHAVTGTVAVGGKDLILHLLDLVRGARLLAGVLLAGASS